MDRREELAYTKQVCCVQKCAFKREQEQEPQHTRVRVCNAVGLPLTLPPFYIEFPCKNTSKTLFTVEVFYVVVSVSFGSLEISGKGMRV